MLPFFPSLLPDELIYSAIARLRCRLRATEHSRFETLIFGDKQRTAVVDLPAHISCLLERIPGNSQLRLDTVLWNHTLLPLHTAFTTAKRARAALVGLTVGSGQGVHRLLNANARMPPTPDSLQFCPDCLAQDTVDYGEPYWHRIHQAPGVTCCPIHGQRLRRSAIQRTRRPNRHAFVPAIEACHQDASVLQCALSLRDQQHVSLDLLWLLETPTMGWETGGLTNAYTHLAVDAGYAKNSGEIALTRLEADLTRHYGEGPLAGLGIPFQEHRKSRSWIVRLVRGDATSFSALQHHLVIRFLGSTVPRFITTARTTQGPIQDDSEPQAAPPEAHAKVH